MISIASDITERKQAEEKLRLLSSVTEQVSDSIIVTDTDFRVTYVNKAARELLGYSIEEALWKHLAGFDAKPLTKSQEQGIHQTVSSGKTWNGTMLKRRKDGSTFLAECSLCPLFDNQGQVSLFIDIERDITERKQAEEALANEAIRRRILIEQSRDGIVILDQNGKVHEANRRFAEMLGYSPEEVLQLYVWDWEFQFPHEQVLDMVRSVDENGDHFDTQHRRKDGTIYDVEISTNGATFAGQKLIFCVCRDITKRKQAEEALIEAEKKYRDLLDNTNELIQSVTPEGRFRYVNNGWKQALGYSDEEIANLSVSDIVPPDYLEHYRMIFEKIKAGEDVGQIKTTFVGKYGNKVIVEGNVTCKFVDGELIYTRNIFRDITKNKYLEDQMFRLSSAVSMSTDCIVITDFNAKIIDINEKTLEMYGADSKDELLGRHFLELIAPAEREIVSNDVGEIIEKGSLECQEYHMLSKQGRECPVQMSTSLVRDADGKPMGMVRVGRELSNLN